MTFCVVLATRWQRYALAGPNVGHGVGGSKARLRDFILCVSNNRAGMSIPVPAWAKLNSLRTGIGQFLFNKYTWGVWLHQ